MQAAQVQGIPLVYVDVDRLDVLEQVETSTQARAFIVDAAQRGYGILLPEWEVTWLGSPEIAWWQLDLETGEMVGVGEDGAHFSGLVEFTGHARAFVSIMHTFMWLTDVVAAHAQRHITWHYYWRIGVDRVLQDEEWMTESDKSPADVYLEALKRTKNYSGDELEWMLLIKKWQDIGMQLFLPIVPRDFE